jgi:hypothetical protein
MSKQIEWWQPTVRPSYIIYSENGVEKGPLLGAEELICDCCNGDVLYTPVAVIGGNALCPECFASVYGKPLEEAASEQGVTLNWLVPEVEQ